MGTFSNNRQSVSSEVVADQDKLVENFRHGEKKAFDQIVAIYEKGVYRLCYRFFNNEEDAMDATQEVFLKVFRSLGKFEGRSSLKTWIYRVASNTCISLSEKRKREKNGLIKIISNWWLDKTVSTPEEDLLDQEKRNVTQKLVSEKVKTLPENYRMPVILKDIEGFSLDKIAEILQIPIGTVKSRINRGRRILQDSLQAYYYGRTE